MQMIQTSVHSNYEYLKKRGMLLPRAGDAVNSERGRKVKKAGELIVHLVWATRLRGEAKMC